MQLDTDTPKCQRKETPRIIFVKQVDHKLRSLRRKWLTPPVKLQNEEL